MPSDDGRGAGAWARRWWRALAAELLGTALLVLLGVASLLPAEAGGAAPELAQPAFAFGGVVLVLVEAAGPASGAHLNPALSLCALLAGRLPAAAAAAYALAQLAGALLGGGALLLLAPGRFRDGAGVTLPAAGVEPGAAAALEALLTGLLALLCCAAWAARAPDPAVSLKFGVAIAGLVFAGGSLTGASLNPARSFAPALLHSTFQHHWVYWVGPLGGAAAAALLHRFVLQPPPAAPAAPETLPLHDKRDR